MLAETPQGMADCPWDVRPHRQLGHWRLPSCPLVTQCPHGCPVPPQSLVCAPGKVRLLGTPQVQRGRKSERLSLQVAEAGVQRAEGVWEGGWTSQRPVLALAKLPLHLSVHGLRRRCLPLTELTPA